MKSCCAAVSACAAVVTVFALTAFPSMATAGPYTAYDKQAKEVLARMSLDEKIGQMIQTDYPSVKEISDIATYHLGSLLFAGSSDPAEGNSLIAWSNAADRAQKEALKSTLGIPLIFGVDAVHGHNNVLNAVVFPHNIGLGCANDAKLTEKIGRITALEMRATGLNWTFAPCVAVARDERWGRTYEAFSEEPTIASTLGAALTRGLQGKSLADATSVAACAKHYLADGGTVARAAEATQLRRPAGAAAPATPPAGAPAGASTGAGTPPVAPPVDGSNNFGGVARTTRSGVRVSINAGDAVISEEELRRIHLPPYAAAIKAGVATMMPSYSSWNGVKLSGSKYLLTDVLKTELGFDGFLISDYNAIQQLDRDLKTAIAMSFNAGMDMAMISGQHRQFFDAVKALVQDGTIPLSRIDDAVTRILRVKFAMGLMDKKNSPLADRSLHESFGSAKHREVARKAVRQSLVVLKNEAKVLPLKKKAARIHVAGSAADDIGIQCGGWTIEWQGRRGAVTSGGTTILAAIRATVSSKTQVTTSVDGSGAAGADVGVVVVGETPYAEGSGDDGDLELSDADRQTIATMKSAGIPVVLVLISGRPLIITEALAQVDAAVAAWLPGTEGQGVADVLFGDYKPTGKLSFTWPRSIDQLPINKGDAKYDPLFAFGYGLTYR